MKKLIALSMGCALLLTSTRCSDDDEATQQTDETKTEAPQGDGSTTPSGGPAPAPAKTAYALDQAGLDTIQKLVFKDVSASTYTDGFNEFVTEFDGTTNFTDATAKGKVKPLKDLIDLVKKLKVDATEAEIKAIATNLDQVFDATANSGAGELKGDFNTIIVDGAPGTTKLAELELNGKKAALVTGLKKLKDAVDAEVKKA